MPSQESDTDSDSDTEMSVNLIEESPPKKHKLDDQKEPVLSDYEQSEE